MVGSMSRTDSVDRERVQEMMMMYDQMEGQVEAYAQMMKKVEEENVDEM